MSILIRSIVVATSLVLLGSSLLAQQPLGSSGETMPPALRAAVRAAMAPPEYELTAQPGAPGWTARNAAQALRARFSPGGVEVAPLDEAQASPMLALQLMGWGASGVLEAPQAAQLAADGARIEYRRGPLVEWYVNGPQGIEQGFFIDAAPPSYDAATSLELRFAMLTRLVARLSDDAQAISFADEQGIDQLSYAHLTAWDAVGKPVEARLVLSDDALSIVLQVADAAFPLTIDPLIATVATKLEGQSDIINSYISMGNAVALAGDLALVGAPERDLAGIERAGVAYLFKRTGTAWALVTTFIAMQPGLTEPVFNGRFGSSVALTSNTLAIHAWTHPGGALQSGAVYVYALDGCCWSPQQKLVAGDAVTSGFFGTSIDISGDTLIAGSDWSVNGEEAYVFTRSGTTWSEQARLQPPPSLPVSPYGFGLEVAIEGNTALVGAPGTWTEPEFFFNHGTAHVFERSGTTWSQTATLFPDTLLSDAAFGGSVALSSDTLVVGAPTDYSPWLLHGSAYVFQKSGGSWVKQAKLLPTGGVTEETYFGASIDIAGNSVVVGEAWDSDGPGGPKAGAAHVFTRSGTTWTHTAEIISADTAAEDWFGISVAVSGSSLLVGASHDGNVDGYTWKGSCYVFTDAGAGFVQQAKLEPIESTDDAFGQAVAISGDFALVGVPDADPKGAQGAGKAVSFVRNGPIWTQQSELIGSPPSVYSMVDQVGSSVAVSGDTIVVGAPYDDENGLSDVGSVYVYFKSGGSWLQQKLMASDKGADHWFGYSVAVEGDWILVGAPRWAPTSLGFGAVYAFLRTGTVWSEQSKLPAPWFGGSFGWDVALSGTTAAIGAPSTTLGSVTSSGALWIYERNGTTWTLQDLLYASDKAVNDRMGESVGLSGDTAIAGAKDEDNAGGNAAGSAYVFSRNGTLWAQQAKLTAPDGAANDQFGTAVAVSGDLAVIGVPRDDFVNGSLLDEGTARVFLRSGTTWTHMKTITMADAASGDWFGQSVALSGDDLIVGASEDDTANGVGAGSATIFKVTFNDDAWTDLGFGLAGTGGIPRFVGSGILAAGSPGNLTLAGAKSSALCQLHVSSSSTPVPFKQGTFVPYPPLFSILLFTSPGGTLSLPFTWPGGVPSGASLWFQYSISDPAAVAGVALSNAIKATTP